MHNIKIPQKYKSLSLFHQHLLSSIKKVFDIIAVSETRVTKQVLVPFVT